MNSTTKQIAKRRIQNLFQQAAQIHKTKPKIAENYLLSARKIAMAARLRLPVAVKRQICKKCNTLLVPGETSRVRIRQKREPHVVITCLHCGNQTRIPLRGKNQEKDQREQNNKQNETSRKA